MAFIEIEFENEAEIEAALDAYELRTRNWLRRTLDELSDAGLRILRMNVPTHSRYLLRHTDKTAVAWRPGGGGGGGSWEQTMGVKRGTSRHPLYVEFGTGLYGRLGWWITPITAPYMVFYGTRARKVLYKRAVRGQKPQRYFFQTWQEMQVYARARILGAAVH